MPYIVSYSRFQLNLYEFILYIDLLTFTPFRVPSAPQEPQKPDEQSSGFCFPEPVENLFS